MLFNQYFKIIESLDPMRIYVENVRAITKLPFGVAKLLCNMAYRDGLFNKKIGVICPNPDCERILASFDADEELPETIRCSVCEANEREEFEFNVAALRKITYYQLKSAINASQ